MRDHVQVGPARTQRAGYHDANVQNMGAQRSSSGGWLESDDTEYVRITLFAERNTLQVLTRCAILYHVARTGPLT